MKNLIKMSAASANKSKTVPQTIAAIYNGVIVSGNVAVYNRSESAGVKSETDVSNRKSIGWLSLTASNGNKSVDHAFKTASKDSKSIDLLHETAAKDNKSVDSLHETASNGSESVEPHFKQLPIDVSQLTFFYMKLMNYVSQLNPFSILSLTQIN